MSSASKMSQKYNLTPAKHLQAFLSLNSTSNLVSIRFLGGPEREKTARVSTLIPFFICSMRVYVTLLSQVSRRPMTSARKEIVFRVFQRSTF